MAGGGGGWQAERGFKGSERAGCLGELLHPGSRAQRHLLYLDFRAHTV